MNASRTQNFKRRQTAISKQSRRRNLFFEILEGRQLLAAINFVNSNGGDWNNAANWNPSRVPAAGDDVTIDVPGTPTVSIGAGNFAARSVTSAEKLVIQGTLTVSTIDATGIIELQGGQLNNAILSARTSVQATLQGGHLSSITLNGNLDVTKQSNATIHVMGNLELNGTVLIGDTAGTTYGGVVFDDSGNIAGSLTGTGTVVFGGNTGNFIENISLKNGILGALTIGQGITVGGKNGGIYNAPNRGSLVNQATINADVTGGSLNLGGARSVTGGKTTATFSNLGTINVSTGTLNLYGSMNLSGLGAINRAGGTINLRCLLDLQGNTWNLNSLSGSWNLAGGTVNNGTINQSDGSLLVMTNLATNTLSSITLNGDLDVSKYSNANVTILGSLVLNGNMFIGNMLASGLTGSTFGSVSFQNSESMPSSLIGTGTVVFGANGNNGINGALTIGPNITVRGINGLFFGSLVNQGTIKADVQSGSIRVLSSTGGSFQNQGNLLASNSSTLGLPGVITVDDSTYLNVSPTSILQLSGSLLSTTRDRTRFRSEGTIVFNGGVNSNTPKLLEAASLDLGSVSTAFTNNFAIGGVTLANNTYLKLVDQFDHASGNDAIYTNSLVVPAGSTLELNGINLYTRGLQQTGTVIGNVTVVPDSGPIVYGIPTPGKIDAAGQEDEWTVFARTGQFLSLQLNPGSNGLNPAISPQLNWSRVEIVDANNVVLASKMNTTAGGILTIDPLSVPADGTYRVRIAAAPAQANSIGNYVVTVWNTTAIVRQLSVNQIVNGSITTPTSLDQWTFTGASGQQVKFHFVNASNSGILFSMNGPNNYVPFVDAGTDSPLLTLPADGTYSITVRSPVGSLGNYSFSLLQTSVTDLLLGTSLTANLIGNGQPQLYRVDLPVTQVLDISLTDAATAGKSELFARLGAPPTRESYDYSATGPGRSQNLFVPSAAPGTWYILVYGDSIPVAGNYSILARGSTVQVLDSSPTKAGNGAEIVLTISGAGYLRNTSVALVASNLTTTISPSSYSIDSYEQITAIFPAGLPADTYSVRVTNGSLSDTRPSALTVTIGGQSRLETQLILPGALGRHAVATFYLEYANTGDLAMPAPLLSLQSADPDNSDKPVLTLDENRIIQNFWSNGLTPGTSNSALILGSGRQPGILNPGERIRVPVHFLGLLQPWDMADTQIELQIRYWTEDDSDSIDWTTRQESLRPNTLGAEQWSAVYGNLTSGLTTTGDYVRMLNQNAKYLGQFGNNVTSVDELWNFELRQAYGFTAIPTLDSVVDASMPSPGVAIQFSRSYSNSLYSRYLTGPLGRGWSAPWQTRIANPTETDFVRILEQDGSARLFQKDTRTGVYFSSVGDSATLVKITSGVFELQSVNGSNTRFRSDGRIDYVVDTNNNRVTAGYDTSKRLTSLTHSSGSALTFSYNAASLIATVTDSAGRTTTYGYDDTTTYLTTVTTSDGKITRYTYQTSGTAQIKHALLSIERGGTTQFFTYNNNGRLNTRYLAGNTQIIVYSYNNTGLVSVDEDIATAGATNLYFDHHGQLAKITDPFGYITTNEFDINLRLTKTVGPTGESQLYSWFSDGSLQTLTDELGYKTTFAYDNPFKRMTSFTDAKGNRTTYTYDANGNLLTTVYPNGTVERLGNYTAVGLPGVSTNRRGQVLSYAFNSRGQVTRQTFADNSVVTFNYDVRGNLSTIVDGSDTTTFIYNFASDGDRLKRITYPNLRFLDYTYDAIGRRIRITDQDGFATKYEYDSVGRLYRLRNLPDVILVTYTYDNAGRLSRIDKGNGTFTTYDYDASGQLLSLKNWRNATSLNSKFDYTYDIRGRRVSMTTVDGTWNYSYDGIGQLIRAVFSSVNATLVPNQDLQYFYDPTGNRTRTVANGVTTSYTSNNMNQYLTVGGIGQSYDADGNITFDGVNTYTWDQLSQLVLVSGPQGVTEYEYDAIGSRVAKVENGVRSAFLVDPIGLSGVMVEFKAGFSNPVHNVYGLGLAARQDGNGLYYYDFDALGSTVGISSSSGIYVNSYDYTPFGDSTTKIASLNNPFSFVGQFGVQSELNGLQFMRARYYKMDSGRFVSQDPIQLSGGQTNFYNYAASDPINRIDPDGERGRPPRQQIPNRTRTRPQIDPNAQRVRERVEKGEDIADAIHTAQQGYPASEYASDFLQLILGTPGYSCLELAEARACRGMDGEDVIFNGCDGNFIIMRCGGDEPPRSQITPGGGGSGMKGGGILGFIVGAFDPNQKLPGAGFGPQSFVSASNSTPYRIDFENYSTATSPAQYVTISDFLSADFDWTSFRLTEFGFGDRLISIPANKQTYQTARSMTYNGKTFDVLIEAGIRTNTGEVYASFQSLDRNTGLPPDVLTGFLPPEDGTGQGLGHVSYTVRPKAGLTTGREIRNVALISFDYQLAIATDQTDPLDPLKGVDTKKQALITIDSGLPTSSVAALPSVTTTASFPISWSGNDDAGGSGIAGYDVYVSTNGGAYNRFLSNTTLTSTVYGGAFGNTYRFYSIATDNVGHRQSTPAAAQALVFILPLTWQNPLVPTDVNDDTFVSPLDALLVINHLNVQPNSIAPLPTPTLALHPAPYIDVNGDNFVTPLDALLVINHLNSRSSGGEGESLQDFGETSSLFIQANTTTIMMAPLVSNAAFCVRLTVLNLAGWQPARSADEALIAEGEFPFELDDRDSPSMSLSALPFANRSDENLLTDEYAYDTFTHDIDTDLLELLAANLRRQSNQK